MGYELHFTVGAKLPAAFISTIEGVISRWNIVERGRIRTDLWRLGNVVDDNSGV